MKSTKDIITELVAWLGDKAEETDEALIKAEFLGDYKKVIHLTGRIEAYVGVVSKIKELLDTEQGD